MTWSQRYSIGRIRSTWLRRGALAVAIAPWAVVMTLLILVMAGEMLVSGLWQLAVGIARLVGEEAAATGRIVAGTWRRGP